MFLYISPPNLRKSSVALFPPLMCACFFIFASCMLYHAPARFFTVRLFFSGVDVGEFYSLCAPLPFTSFILFFAPCTPSRGKGHTREGGNDVHFILYKTKCQGISEHSPQNGGFTSPSEVPFFLLSGDSNKGTTTPMKIKLLCLLDVGHTTIHPLPPPL